MVFSQKKNFSKINFFNIYVYIYVPVLPVTRRSRKSSGVSVSLHARRVQFGDKTIDSNLTSQCSGPDAKCHLVFTFSWLHLTSNEVHLTNHCIDFITNLLGLGYRKQTTFFLGFKNFHNTILIFL